MQNIQASSTTTQPSTTHHINSQTSHLPPSGAHAFYAQRQVASGAPSEGDAPGAREGEPGNDDFSSTGGGGDTQVSPLQVGGNFARHGGSFGAQGGSLGGGFARDSARRSLANNAAMWRWLEAQEKTQQHQQQQQQQPQPPLHEVCKYFVVFNVLIFVL